MKCKDCSSCEKGWFSSRPYDYVCIGVKYPFVIDDIDELIWYFNEYKDSL